MGNTHVITRNIAHLYDLAQMDIRVERIAANLYRFALPGYGTYDYNPKRNTVKKIGTAKDIKAEPNVVEWARKKMKMK